MKIKANILTKADNGVKFNVHATIPFKEIRERIKFTSRHSVKTSPYSNEESEMYQRQVEPKRIKDMKQFVLEEVERDLDKNDISVLFPTTIILSAIIEYEDLTIKDGILEFDLDDIWDKMLVVDGQHRLKSLDELLSQVEKQEDSDEYKGIPKDKIIDYISNHLLSCTLLINFDIWDQAQVFMSVNFHQKKVSKSLSYDIYGLMPDELQNRKRNKLKVIHDIAKYLNTFHNSPIKGFVKMLGTGPGYISQAFLVDALFVHFEPRGIWHEACKKYIEEENDKACEHIPFEVIAYFNAIKKVCNKVWPKGLKDNTTIICKTTSMGALLHLLGDLHENIPVNDKLYSELGNMHTKDVYTRLTDFYVKCLYKLGVKQEYFFKKNPNNKYVSSAGASQQRKMYLELRKLIIEDSE